MIFWVGSLIVGFGMFFVANWVLQLTWPLEPEEPSWRLHDYHADYCVLAVQFFLAFVMANAANRATRRKPWYARVPFLLMFLVLYFLPLFLLNINFSRPAINVMQFLACMLPAHYWGQFTDSPAPRTAWKALFAFVLGAAAFFLVSYFGEDFAQILVGPPPQ